jgi:hypothetical protein
MLNRQRLPDFTRRAYVQTIEGYLDYCRMNGVSVGVDDVWKRVAADGVVAVASEGR